MEEIMRRRNIILTGMAGVVLLAAGITSPTAAPAAEFFAGKTLTMVNNYPPGGASDTEGRIFARFLPKYIPGNPKIIFKNVAGAGGLTGFNWLGEVAKPDGLTASFMTWNPMLQIVKDPALRVPFDKFVFVAGVSPPIVAFIRKDVKPGINSPADFLKAHDFKIAGLSDAAVHDVRNRLSLDLLLGPVYGNVTGFRGFAPMFKAILQNEVQFSSSSIPGYQGTVVPTMVEPGLVIPVFHFEVSKSDGTFQGSPDVGDIPTYLDLYKMKNGKDAMPSGIKWEALKLLNILYTNLLRTVLMPPGAPQEAADALAKGFDGLANDAEFLAAYKKIVKAPPNMITGTAGRAVIANISSVDPKLVSFFKQYIADARK
jgi:tripartite-type tricarboxylate transporter receptor subunit TctC